MTSQGAPTLSLGTSKRKVFGKPPATPDKEPAAKPQAKPAIKLAAKKPVTKNPSLCVVTTGEPTTFQKKPIPVPREDKDDEYDYYSESEEPSPKRPTPNKASETQKGPSPAAKQSAILKKQDSEDDYYSYSDDGEGHGDGAGALGDDVFDVLASLVSELNQGKLKEAWDALEEWQQQFLDSAQPLEREQLSFWYKSVMSLLSQQNLVVVDDSRFKEPVLTQAKNVLRKHRFAYHDRASHVLRLAICGPRQSGKSNLMSVIARQAIVDMIASGDWKQTLVFAMDVSLLTHLFTDIKGLYRAIVQLTFQALAVQKPLIAQYASGLVSAFESVVEGNPLLPKPFVLSEDFRLIVPELKKIMDILTLCWNDPTAMGPFLTNVFKLPMLLGDVFGFKRYFMIVDHIDAADVTLRPMEPFVDTETQVFVVELVKFMVMSSSFVVSCRDGSALSNVLANLNENSIDLNDGVEFLSTLDVVEPRDVDKAKEFVVSFEQVETPFTLKVTHFGGCAAYLERWRDLMDLADEIERCSKKDDDCEEQKLFLNTSVQAVIRQLFTQPNGEPLQLSVKSANRVDAKNQQKQ